MLQFAPKVVLACSISAGQNTIEVNVYIQNAWEILIDSRPFLIFEACYCNLVYAIINSLPAFQEDAKGTYLISVT